MLWQHGLNACQVFVEKMASDVAYFAICTRAHRLLEAVSRLVLVEFDVVLKRDDFLLIVEEEINELFGKRDVVSLKVREPLQD